MHGFEACTLLATMHSVAGPGSRSNMHRATSASTYDGNSHHTGWTSQTLLSCRRHRTQKRGVETSTHRSASWSRSLALLQHPFSNRLVVRSSACGSPRMSILKTYNSVLRHVTKTHLHLHVPPISLLLSFSSLPSISLAMSPPTSTFFWKKMFY